MRSGVNARQVVQDFKERLDELSASLPEDVEIVTTYDRTALIDRAVGTLTEKLVEEMLAVAVVCALFLLHLRSSLVAIISLPLAILMSFILMSYQGITANIMSLGGIAVAIGALVDGLGHRAVAEVGPVDRRVVGMDRDVALGRRPLLHVLGDVLQPLVHRLAVGHVAAAAPTSSQATLSRLVRTGHQSMKFASGSIGEERAGGCVGSGKGGVPTAVPVVTIAAQDSRAETQVRLNARRPLGRTPARRGSAGRTDNTRVP